MMIRFQLLVLMLFIGTGQAFGSVCDFVTSNSVDHSSGLSPKQRARILCGLRTAMLEKYSLQEWKKETLGIEVSKHFDGCVLKELGGRRETRIYPDFDFPQLELEDGVLRCLAPFADTHLQMTSQTERPHVYAGFRLARVGGQYFVASVSKTIQATWPEAIKNILVPGARIEKLEGADIGEKVQALSSFVSGSSKAFVVEESTRALTDRNFAYPSRGKIFIKLAGRTAIEVPWWSVGLNQRQDTRALFGSLSIHSAHGLELDIQQKIRNGEDDLGFTPSTPLLALDKLTTFYDDDARPGLRLGTLQLAGKGICYIQLLTFGTKRWRLGSAAGRALPFDFPFSQQLAICRAAAYPLLLDLRWNNGGDSDAPAKLLGLLARTGEVYPSTLVSGLLTAHFRAVLEKFNLGEGFPQGDLSSPQGRLTAALEQASQAGDAYLPYVASPDISGSLAGGSFDLPITALISPSCISACDLMAKLLKQSGRAKLLGNQSNGTGGRFLEVGELPKSGWVDDEFGTIAVRIPNSIHAVLPHLRDSSGGNWFFNFEKNKNWMMENRPVVADFKYETTEVDLSQNGAGWLAAAMRTLGDR